MTLLEKVASRSDCIRVERFFAVPSAVTPSAKRGAKRGRDVASGDLAIEAWVSSLEGSGKEVIFAESLVTVLGNRPSN
jgi:hypothetical protein